ncbi:MAG: hypothetical protein AAF518_15620 [Spirochaetota bacterium]
MIYLVVGATSVAGRATIQAIREFHADATVIGTTSKAGELGFCDETITGVDLSQQGAVEKIVHAVGIRKVEKLFFTPSMGMVGHPSEEAISQDIETALSFSYRPIPILAEKLHTQVVGFSSFYWLSHIRVAYGAMAAVKYGIESLALARPDRFRVIRSGLFESKSLRGIILMVRRTLKTTENASLLSLQKRWKQSGMSFNEFFFHFSYEVESLAYGDRFKNIAYRKTVPEDIQAAVLRLLSEEPGPIYNVMGDWQWQDQMQPPISAEELQPIQPFFTEMQQYQNSEGFALLS